MSRYEKYKDSGIAWIGEIPAEWEVKRLKNVCVGFSNGTSAEQLSAETTQYKVTRIETISTGEINCNKIGYVINTKELQRFKLKKNDILISNINSFRMIGNCAIFDGNCDLYHGMNLIKISPLPIIFPRLLLNYLKTELFTSQMQRTSKPAINQVSVPSSVIKQMFIVLPSIGEQKMIAEFLDRKCGEIDELVALQETMIGEFVAYKQSVITEAVTRGLNPDAPLRDSGIEWIGSIPAHWEVKRIKNCIDNSFAGVWGEDAKNDDNDVRCYRVADFNYKELCLSNNNPTNRNIDKKTFIQRAVNIGDILIEKSGGGDKSPVGRAVYVNYDVNAICSNFVHCIKVDKYNFSKYLVYLFCVMYGKKVNVLFFNQTTGIQNLDVSGYFNNETCVPPLQEQQAIADHLDRKCEEIDQLIAIKREKIDQLKEYKKSVIFEYVTGKKRVQ